MIYQEISCENCGACCRSNIVHRLSEDEAKHLEAAGTDLLPMLRPPQSKVTRMAKELLKIADPDYYVLKTDCGYFNSEDLNCGDYENRPQSCVEFKVGGYACRQIRVRAGIDLPESFELWKEKTAS